MRYFLSPLIGNGTHINPFRAKAGDYPGVGCTALIPSQANGSPKFPWGLAAIKAVDYSALLADATLFPLPDISFNQVLSDLILNRIKTRLSNLGVSTTELTSGILWRHVLGHVGRRLEPGFDELRHLRHSVLLIEGGAIPFWPLQGGSPGIICSDQFNRADSDILGTLDNGLGGSGTWTWTEVLGDIDIVSNQAKGSMGAGDFYARAKVTEDVGTTNYKITADYVYQANAIDSGPAGRIVDGSNFKAYVLGGSGAGNLRLWKQVTGSFTSLYSATKTVSANVTLAVKLDGNDWEIWYGGVSESTGTDTSNTTGVPGIGYAMNTRGGSVDNFICEDLAAGVSGPPAGSWMMMGVGV